MNNEIKLTYEQAISLKIYEGELVWSRSATMLLVNTILLTAMGIFLSDDTPNQIVICMLSLFGLSISFIWLVTTVRGFGFNNFWANLAREAEEKTKNVKLLTKGEAFRNNLPVEFEFIDKETNLKKRQQRHWILKHLFRTETGAYILIILFILLYSIIFLVTLVDINLIKA